MTDPAAALPFPAGTGESLDSAILRLLMETIPDRIYFKNLESRFVRVNASHARFLGMRSPDEMIGKNDFDFFTPDHARRALAGEQEIIRTGIPMVGRVESITKRDGSKAWGSTTKMPWRDGTGRIIGTFGLTRDVTAAKEAEDKLQRRSAEMEADLQMARQIQEAFFPTHYPVFPHGAAPAASQLLFDHRYVAAATLGGDFFDIIPLSDTRCGMLVCDVMGHGVRAGLLTALIRGAMEELGTRAGEPAHVLGEINRGLMPIVEQTRQPVFATAFYAVIDLAAGTMCYANAGHPPPFIVRSVTGAIERLALENPEPATGLVENFVFTQRDYAFGAGDCLVGYTDGLVEATNTEGQMFGDERLQTALQDSAAHGESQRLQDLLRAVERFTGRKEFEDDLCLLTVWRPGATDFQLPLRRSDYPPSVRGRMGEWGINPATWKKFRGLTLAMSTTQNQNPNDNRNANQNAGGAQAQQRSNSPQNPNQAAGGNPGQQNRSQGQPQQQNQSAQGKNANPDQRQNQGQQNPNQNQNRSTTPNSASGSSSASGQQK